MMGWMIGGCRLGGEGGGSVSKAIHIISEKQALQNLTKLFWMDGLIACWRVGWHSVFSVFGGGRFDVWSGILGVVKL